MYIRLRFRHILRGLAGCFICMTAGDVVNASGSEESAAAASGQLALMAGGCVTCHGARSQPHGSIPALARRSAAELESMLLAFKHDGGASGTIMDRIAKGFSDEELAELARYFANLDSD